MKLYSWNVNGIRACHNKGELTKFLAAHQPDVLCLQETKARPEQFTADLGYEYQFWNSADKPGYSGTAIYCRTAPTQVTLGLGIAELDTEGRVITAEFDGYYLVNVYTPNSQDELRRLAYRTQKWDPAFRSHIVSLDKHKPVLICGDLNCAHTELDIARPKDNVKTAGFTPEERAELTRHLEAGFVDTFRLFESGGGHYSWWSMRGGARARNVGWRIDYFLASKRMRPRIRAAHIHADVLGSDHCPVSVELA